LRNGQPAQQRLRVCEACGAQLNILDHESRLADHYGGKMHLGMVQIREKYEEMKASCFILALNSIILENY
jgi:RNA-binding protein Luc7-like 2